MWILIDYASQRFDLDWEPQFVIPNLFILIVNHRFCLTAFCRCSESTNQISLLGALKCEKLGQAGAELCQAQHSLS